MQINKITIQNLKGVNTTDILGPETLIIGKNFSGKTARLQAIQLLLLGYIPGLPRTNPGIYQLASGRDMFVEGWGTDDYHVHRSFEREGGKISRTDNPIGLKDATEPLVAMLDASAFLAASGPDKLEMIFRLANVQTDETVKSLRNKCGAVEWDVAVNAAQISPVRDWIAEALPYAQEQLKFSKQQVDRLAKTQQGLESLQDEEDGETLPNDLSGEIARLEASRKPLEARQTELATLKRAGERALSEYDRCVRNLAAEKLARENKRKELSGKAAMQAAIEATEKVIAGLGDETAATVETKRSRYMALDRGVADTNRAIDTSYRNHEKAVKDLAELEGLSCCPFCKSKGKTWKKELQATFEEQRDQAKAEMDRLNGIIEQQEEECDDAERDVKNAEESLRLFREHNQSLANDKAILTRLEQFERDLAVPLVEPTRPTESSDTVAEEMQLENQLDEITQRLGELRALRAKDSERQARAATVAQSQLAAKKAEDEKATWSTAVKVLEEARSKMVGAAFTTLLKLAQPVYSDILSTPLMFHNGQLGRMTNAGSDFIPLSAFSGTEMLVATISLQVALGANSPAKIALLDELGRMDSDNKTTLVKNLHGMIERGELDQWIGIDVTKQPKLPKFITLIAP